MKSTTGGQWRISGRSRGPRTAFARVATSLVLATASFSVAGFGATSLASAAATSRHSAAATSRHSTAAASRHSTAAASRHSTAATSRHSAAAASRHSTAAASRHSTAAASRHSAAAASRHSTAGGPLSCDGGTIYSYQRGSDSAAAGSVYALDTSTVGKSTVAATLVTKVPSGGNANALGITKGGAAMYAVNQTTSKANSAVFTATAPVRRLGPAIPATVRAQRTASSPAPSTRLPASTTTSPIAPAPQAGREPAPFTVSTPTPPPVSPA